MNIDEFCAALARKFPHNADAVLAWKPDYRTVLGPDVDLAASLQATLAKWPYNTPPKPAQFQILHKPSGGAAKLVDRREDNTLVCTRAGFERVYAIRRRMVDDALRYAGDLTPEEARAATSLLWDRAWLAAQHEVITGTVESLTLTPEDMAEVRSIVAWINRPEKERLGGIRRPLAAPQVSDRQRERMRALADQHRAAAMGEGQDHSREATG